NRGGALPGAAATRSRNHWIVLSTLPTSTTNITGFFAMIRGSSLRTLSIAAARSSRRSHADTARMVLSLTTSEHLSSLGEEMLDDRPEAERGEERQSADDRDHTHEQHDEERAGGGQRSGSGRDRFLAGKTTCDRERGDDHPEPSRQHDETEGRVVPSRVGIQPRERGAVVSGCAREGIEDLGKPVRTGVVA